MQMQTVRIPVFELDQLAAAVKEELGHDPVAWVRKRDKIPWSKLPYCSILLGGQSQYYDFIFTDLPLIKDYGEKN